MGLEGDVARARPSRSENSTDSASRSAEMLEAAISRTLPARTSSSSTPMISSTGTEVSSKWV